MSLAYEEEFIIKWQQVVRTCLNIKKIVLEMLPNKNQSPNECFILVKFCNLVNISKNEKRNRNFVIVKVFFAIFRNKND
jgi:hypothetical protein